MLELHYTSIIHDLFSKVYFSVAIQDLSEGEAAGVLMFRYESSADDIRIFKFRGKVANAKHQEELFVINDQILDMDIAAVIQ